jgi:hypothetical protein
LEQAHQVVQALHTIAVELVATQCFQALLPVAGVVEELGAVKPRLLVDRVVEQVLT